MNIKKLVKFSFLLISLLIIIITTINSVVLYQIKENNESKNNISKLVSFQEEMNSLSKDTMRTKNIKNLDSIKENFIKYEKEFEDIKHSFILNDQNDFIDNFIQDIHKDKIIFKNLELLFKNEIDIENAFDKMYGLQKEKIKLIDKFNVKSPIEKSLRNQLEVKILNTKNLSLVKHFGDIKYYSKETLYQYRDIKSLERWLNKIYIVNETYHNKSIQNYINTVKEIGSYTIRIKNIELEEAKLINDILEIISLNKEVNLEIINDIDKLSTYFINFIYLTVLILLILTIAFIMVVAYKVNKNVGLSVDEIETKVQNGLKEIKLLNDEIETTQQEVVFTMGAIGEQRSKETGNHVKRVAKYSKLLALYYGLDKKEAEMLKQASPMHDIGKIAIPDNILNKPGRFTPQERTIMDTHVSLGYDMLKGSSRPLLQIAAIVAHEHHEKWDGTGYPNRKKGKDIHIYGRITALADVFDALGSSRVYKEAWSDEKIFNLFKQERGKHFEPKLIDIFFDNLDEFLVIRDNLRDKF